MKSNFKELPCFQKIHFNVNGPIHGGGRNAHFEASNINPLKGQISGEQSRQQSTMAQTALSSLEPNPEASRSSSSSLFPQEISTKASTMHGRKIGAMNQVEVVSRTQNNMHNKERSLVEPCKSIEVTPTAECNGSLGSSSEITHLKKMYPDEKYSAKDMSSAKIENGILRRTKRFAQSVHDPLAVVLEVERKSSEKNFLFGRSESSTPQKDKGFNGRSESRKKNGDRADMIGQGQDNTNSQPLFVVDPSKKITTIKLKKKQTGLTNRKPKAAVIKSPEVQKMRSPSRGKKRSETAATQGNSKITNDKLREKMTGSPEKLLKQENNLQEFKKKKKKMSTHSSKQFSQVQKVETDLNINHKIKLSHARSVSSLIGHQQSVSVQQLANTTKKDGNDLKQENDERLNQQEIKHRVNYETLKKESSAKLISMKRKSQHSCFEENHTETRAKQGESGVEQENSDILNRKRREEIGVAFLNNLNESFIRNRIELQKTKKEMQLPAGDDSQAQKKIVSPNSEEVKKFMILKKKRIEIEIKKRLEDQKERQERLKNNLQLLDQEIKQCRQTAVLHPGPQSLQRSKSVIQRKQQGRTSSIPNLHSLHSQSLVSGNYKFTSFADSENAGKEDSGPITNNYFIHSLQQQQMLSKQAGNSRINEEDTSNCFQFQHDNFDEISNEYKKLFYSKQLYSEDKPISQNILLAGPQSACVTPKNFGKKMKKQKKEVSLSKQKSLSLHSSNSMEIIKPITNIRAKQGQIEVNKPQSDDQLAQIQHKDNIYQSSNGFEKLPQNHANTIQSIQNTPSVSAMDSLYKKLSAQSAFLASADVSAAAELVSKDKFLFDLIHSKKEELKERYAQMSNRMTKMKEAEIKEQCSENIQAQTYYQQKPTPMAKQHVSQVSNTVPASSCRKSHTNKSTLIKEETEEDDTHYHHPKEQNPIQIPRESMSNLRNDLKELFSNKIKAIKAGEIQLSKENGIVKTSNKTTERDNKTDKPQSGVSDKTENEKQNDTNLSQLSLKPFPAVSQIDEPLSETQIKILPPQQVEALSPQQIASSAQSEDVIVRADDKPNLDHFELLNDAESQIVSDSQAQQVKYLAQQNGGEQQNLIIFSPVDPDLPVSLEQQETVQSHVYLDEQTNNGQRSYFQDQNNLLNNSNHDSNNQEFEHAYSVAAKEGAEMNSNDEVEFLYELNFEQLEELKAMLLNSDPNQPEVQTLFEQLQVYYEAAVLIQKNIRGCLTRKYIYAILEYQQQEEEKENQIFMQAEKFLEESQIDPEELLEGNPMPFRQQHQRDLYYHPQDQLHELEQHEIQDQQLDNCQDQQHANVDHSQENQQATIVNFLNEKQLIQTLEASQQKIPPAQGRNKEETLDIQAHNNEGKQTPEEGIRLMESTAQMNQDEKISMNSSSKSSSLQMKSTIAILKEEQAKKWNDMMTQLQLLQQDGSSNLNDKTKAFLDRLQKQSELNKQILIDGNDRSSVNLYSEDKKNEKDSEEEKGEGSQEKNVVDNNVNGQQSIEKEDQNNLSNEEGLNFARKNLSLEISHRGNLEVIETPNEEKELFQSPNSSKQSDNYDLEQTPQRIVREQNKQQAEEEEQQQEHVAIITKALVLSDSTKLRGKISPLYDEEIVNTSSSQNDSVSIINSSSLLFQQQPFKEFTKSIIQKLAVPHKQVDQLLKDRENAIDGKHQSQINLIEKMQQKQKISPKSFERKRFQLEKWATKEKEELKTVKSQIEKGWEQFALTIKRTKRDLEFIEQTKKVDTSKLIQSTEEDQLRKLLSIRTETDNSLEDFEKRYPETVRSVELAGKIKVIDAYQPLELIISSQNNQLSNESQTYPQSSSHSKHGLPSSPPLAPNSPKDAMTDIFGHNFSSYNPRHLTLSQEIIPKAEDGSKSAEKEMIVKITENLISSQQQPSATQKKKDEMEETNKLESDKLFGEEWSNSCSSSKGEINISGHEQDNKLLKTNLTVDQRRSRMIADISLPVSVQTPDKTAEESTFKTPDPSLFATAQQDTSNNKFKSVKWGESSDSSQVLELLAETSPRGLINSLESFKADFKKQPDNEEKEKLSPFSPIMPIFGRKGINQPHSRKTLDFNGNLVDEPKDKIEKNNEELKPFNESKGKDKQEDSPSKKRLEDIDKIELKQVIPNNQELLEQNLASPSITNGPGLECSTLNFVKDYLVAFSEFVKDNFRDDFLERVNVPLGMDPQEFLKTFTITETLDSSDGEITAAPIYPIVKFIHMQSEVISEELFGLFNDIFNRERDLNGMTEDLFIMESYHMKLVYDCFNEALDSMRPFGLRGKPLPWKINSNKLSSITITPDNIEKILGLAIAKVLKWGSFLCGFIPERIESPTGEIIQIDNEYLNQIKEDRLAQMLENDVIENEDKWLIYEDEETDVQLEISDEVFNFLVEETAMLLYELESNKESTENGSTQDKVAQEVEDQQQKIEEDSLNAEDMIVESLFSNTLVKEGKKANVCIRPTMDLGLTAAVEEEEKKLKRELFVKNLKAGFALKPQSNHAVAASKDALNSSF